MDFIFYYFALLAQLAEQLPFKEKVTGSNPVQRTKLDFPIFWKPKRWFARRASRDTIIADISTSENRDYNSYNNLIVR